MVVFSDATERDRNGKVKRTRRWFAKEEDARKHHASLVRAAADVGTAGLNMDAKARADYFAARILLDKAGFADTSLTDAVRAHLRSVPAPRKRAMKMDDAIEQFLAGKSDDENAAARTVSNLKYRIGSWRDREKLRTLADITEEGLLRLRSRTDVSPQTRINDMAAVSSFMSWLAERKLMQGNPLLKMRRPRTDVRQPRVLKPEQVKELLNAALAMGEGRLLRYLALQLLAGLRPSEAAALRPDQVTSEGDTTLVRILRGKRRGKIRAATALPNFRAWWDAAPWPARTTEPATDPVPLWRTGRDRRLFNEVRERAGLLTYAIDVATRRPRRVASEWEEDICRHTWISVRIQQTKNEAQVAFEAGNSPEIIHGHYLALFSSAEVAEILRICPPPQIVGNRRSA